MVGAGTDRTRPRLGGGPTIILVRPQLAVNIGMCARAMANFGLDDLRLVNPRQGWPRDDEYREVAAHYGLDHAPNFENRHWHLRIAGGGRRPHTVYVTTERERADEAS
jgi:tRNA/rRNA methyltransferase